MPGFLFYVLYHNHMIILQTHNYGYDYIDDNGDYFTVIDNNDCVASCGVYPVMLGPFEDFTKFHDDIPF